MLTRCATGFGSVALWGLLGDKAFGTVPLSASDPSTAPWAVRPPHFPAKVRHIIFLYMDGGVSQVDSFDPKPRLAKENGAATPTMNMNDGWIMSQKVQPPHGRC